jgi:hypothetical protein
MHGLERIADWVGVAGAGWEGVEWDGGWGWGRAALFLGTFKSLIIIELDKTWLVSSDSNGVVSLL